MDKVKKLLNKNLNEIRIGMKDREDNSLISIPSISSINED